MHCGGHLEIVQRDSAARDRSSSRGVYEKLLGHTGQIDDDSFANVSPAHGTACAPGDESHSIVGGPCNQRCEIICVGGSGDSLRKDSIDACALRICGACPGVSAEGATKSRWRQHRPKLIMFTLYG
jgi:hypothetical protein